VSRKLKKTIDGAVEFFAICNPARKGFARLLSTNLEESYHKREADYTKSEGLFASGSGEK
jgi:hypothetical protein